MYVHTLGGNEGFAGHCALWKEAKEALFPTLTVLLYSSYYIRTYVHRYVCTVLYMYIHRAYKCVWTYVCACCVAMSTYIYTYVHMHVRSYPLPCTQGRWCNLCS